MSELNLAKFVCSHTPTVASTTALARTFPKLLTAAADLKDANVLTEIVTVLAQVRSGSGADAASVLAVHSSAMTPAHVVQLLATGERRVSVLARTLACTVNHPSLTSAVLKRSNWAKSLIYAASEKGCKIVDSSVPARKHEKDQNLACVIMAMATQPNADQIVKYLLKYKSGPRYPYINYEFSKLATDPAVFVAAIKAVKKEDTVAPSLVTLAAVPTTANREAADELLHIILEMHAVEEILREVGGDDAILNVLANPYVAPSIIKKLNISKLRVTTTHKWKKLNQPELRKVLIHSPNIFNEEGLVQVEKISNVRGFSPEAAQAVEGLHAAVEVINASIVRVTLLHELLIKLTTIYKNVDGLTPYASTRINSIHSKAANVAPASTKLFPETLQFKSNAWLRNFLKQMSKHELESSNAVFKEATSLLGTSIPLWISLYELIGRGMTPKEALNIVDL